MRKAARFGVVALVLLVSGCSPPVASDHSSARLVASSARSSPPLGRGGMPPSSNPSLTGHGPALGALGVAITVGERDYTVSLVSTSGQVVAQAKALLPTIPSTSTCSQPGCDRLSYPLTSTSDSRVYFLDGDVTVKYLMPTGETGVATTITAGPKTLVAFAVSPDDRRIAVSLLDYSALPGGQIKLHMYAADVGGDNRVDFFSGQGVAEWPIGWHSGQLVVALAAGAGAAAANPYAAAEYHVVDPATGNRLVVIGHPSENTGPTCTFGPVVAAGAACYKAANGQTELGIQGWNGAYTLVQRTSAATNPVLALSPDGTEIAAQLSGNPDGPLAVFGQTVTFAGAGTPLAWFDDNHILVRKANQLGVYELNSQKLQPLSFGGAFGGSIPGDLDISGMPDGRGAAQVAYDSANHFAVMFGGDGPNGPLGDTWTWNGRRWTPVPTDIAPSARQGGAFIYDPVRHVSVMFGGAGQGGWGDPLGETWTFDGSRWTRQLPTTSPSPRAFAAVTFDTKRGVVVLFGGYTGQTFLNDVWTWDGANWTQQASSLPPMYPLGLAYRSADDSMLLVGQAAGAGIQAGVQTWTYAQQTWRPQTPAGAPSCIDHYGGSAEDVQKGALVFFGGYCPNSTVVWNGSAWSETTPKPSPAARGNEAGRPAMTYDPDLGVVLLFGGVANGTYFNDMWAWDGAAWSNVG